ncbi:MAG: hypothetical protein PUD59_05445 [bacterium]|nr:hypothetical protein [bacterium]
MKKSSAIIIAIATIFAVFIGYKYIIESKNLENNDGLKFKNEYEILNNRVNISNNKVYPNVQISEDNIIKYSSYDEVIDILKNGTGVIYLGYPECPWCRNLVPVLLEAANEVELNKIYYLNIKEDRDLYSLDENNKVIKEKDGSEDYYKLIEVLDSILNDYTLTSSDEVNISTGEKRIYVPLVIFVKDGKIVGHHTDTVESQEDPYILLNDRQEEELLVKLTNYMNRITGIVCDESC